VIETTTSLPSFPLGDVCRTTSGGTPSRKRADYFEGDIPWVKSGELTDGLVSEVSEFITEEAVANSSAKLFPVGTLLIAMYGATVGKLGVLAKPAATNQAVCAIFPPPELDSKFLFWFLRFKRSYLIDQAVGGAQPNISQSILRELMVPVPPIDVQSETVAEIEKQFSRLDEAVANLQRVKANLKRYKASVLKAAVEGRLVETEASIAQREGRSYETGEQLLQRILEDRRSTWAGRGKWKVLESPLADTTLPDGWAWSCIDQLADVGTGATPKRDKAVYWSDGDVPWVTSSVVNGDYVDEASEFVTKLALAETNLTLYPAGTLLLAMYGEGKTRGKCAELRVPATTNQALAALQVASSVRAYVRQFLELNYEEMRKVASGGVQPNLNLSLVRAVCVPLPPLAEQIRIVAEVDRHLSIVRGVEVEIDTNLKRAQALRQTSLQRAFSLC
jgi:type I restriction enzyme S subunit